MSRQWLRAWGPIGLTAALLWTGLVVIDLSSAEARVGGSHGGARGGGFGGGLRGGSHGGIGHGFRGGISHGFRGGVGHGFRGGLHGGGGHGFHHHGFHHHGHNHFFFSVGVGAFYPFSYYPYYYPVGYPYPVYYPAYAPVYQYSQYSPCGYYDPSGVWINAPCPQYVPPVSAPQPQGSAPEGVATPAAEQSSEGATGPPSPGY